MQLRIGEFFNLTPPPPAGGSSPKKKETLEKSEKLRFYIETPRYTLTYRGAFHYSAAKNPTIPFRTLFLIQMLFVKLIPKKERIMQKRFIFIFLLSVGFSSLLYSQDNYEKRRAKMVRHQIKARGIKDKNTLNAMNTVPRHMFVPDEYQYNAYADKPLPIGYGQTISQPYIVAYMTELLHVGSGDTVLEIGTGSGYQAAVLSGIVNKVYTIEIIKELGLLAKKRLKTLKYNNVEVKIADGYYGWKEHGPYAGIVVTAASEYIPPPLIAQLKDGGRMIIPIGSPFSVQNLMLVTKTKGKIITQNMMLVRFVPLTRE
jgi:protein-L-isoaspartate(D-aspartate) O-methyltransferase